MNPDASAFPQPPSPSALGTMFLGSGLTKREYMLTHVLAAIAPVVYDKAGNDYNSEKAAKVAAAYVDAMLKLLEEPETNT